MRVLVACEFSGIVREAFARLGHDAVSCDLLPTEIPGKHIQDDVLNIIDNDWDMMVAFPPCTYLALSGARWHHGTWERELALDFVLELLNCDIPKIALENPVGAINSQIALPDQIIQPYWFGHGETKKTCLWLQGLPKLVPTNVVPGREPRVHWENGKNHIERWKDRSRTLEGIANAMAQQWG